MVGSQRQLFMLFGAGALFVFLSSSLKVLGSNVSSELAAVPTTLTPKINLVQAVVLGIVQGLTEFLPISSTGHLKVVSVAMGWGNPSIAFTASLELGSIAAVLWYFWKDLVQITVGAIKAIQESDYQSHDFRLVLGIGLGTLPIVLFGLLIKVFIPDFDHSPLRSLSVLATASIVMSLLLGLAEKLGKRKRSFKSLGVRDGILMGLAQAMAIIPGVSRSGSTLTAGLFMGLERATDARFSFLLAIPAITLTGLVELNDALEGGLGDAQLVPLIVGIIFAAVFSYAAIAWLLRFLQTRDTWIFVWYRLVFGSVILCAIATGLLKNI
ncbi:MAG TPA: undecaprenyl-diphosphate phosphatase [Coleofasciculaceae cyanobacterium]|jgi:undecaprenyl-diphosphatase